MYSKHHAIVSFVIGVAGVYLLPPISVVGIELPSPVLLVYAVAIGVLIDLDHFLIARARTGTWDAVRYCLHNPLAAATDQRGIFAPGDVGVLPRLLSHLLLGGLVVGLLAVESVPLAVLTGVVLYAHLVCDVCWDIWQLTHRRADQPAADRLETVI